MERLLLFRIITCSLLCIGFVGTVPISPIIKTPNGLIQGTIGTSRNGNYFQQFLGIQFAHVPGRFEIAVPVSAWEGIKSAENYGRECNNLIVPEDEDCLYLNVYAPVVNNSSGGDKYPVLVYIHGGSFQYNSNRKYGPKYLMDENIVLVVIQYRLGIFGFLSTGDSAAPGNYGLKDQVSALIWIQANIEAFGGDKDKVTLMGQSAGGVSVTYHLVSPMSRGLFHRAIAQSGTFLAPWAFTRNPNHYAVELAKAVNCPISSSEEMVNCLKRAPLSELTDYCMKWKITIKWHKDPLAPFGPVIEPTGSSTAFLDSSPYELLVSGKLSNNVPLLTGLTKEEGVYLWSYYIMYSQSKPCNETAESDYPWLHDLQTKWLEIAPGTFYFDEVVPENMRDSVSNQIRDFYFGRGAEINRSKFYDLSHAYSDRLFVNSGMKFINLYSQHAPVYPYLYVFNKYWGLEFGRDTVDLIPDQAIEATHSAELDMLFSPLFNLTRNTKEQNELSRSMVKLWVSFAKNGIPSDTYGGATEFPEADPLLDIADLKFYQLDYNTSIIENIYSERYAFWESIGLENYEQRFEAKTGTSNGSNRSQYNWFDVFLAFCKLF